MRRPSGRNGPYHVQIAGWLAPEGVPFHGQDSPVTFGRGDWIRILPVKGVAMKRIALLLCAMLVLLLGNGRASASWGQLTYSGYQPWYNIFAKRYKCLTPEEERL